MSMHETDPSPSQAEPKHPSRYIGKTTVKRTQAVVPVRLSVLEAFFSELPLRNMTHYIRCVDTTPLITDLAAAPYKKEKVLDTVEVGTSLILTSIEQIHYQIVPHPFLPQNELVKIDKNSGAGLISPILFNLKANETPIFDWNYDDTIGSGSADLEASGTTITDTNILDYGKHDAAVCILENTDLIASWYLFGNAVGTNTADFVTVRLRGFKLPIKVLQEARLKFGF